MFYCLIELGKGSLHLIRFSRGESLRRLVDRVQDAHAAMLRKQIPF